jgi:hypothetical protein
MFNSLTEDESLSKNAHSYNVLARRHLAKENEILKQCEQSGQVAGKYKKV